MKFKHPKIYQGSVNGFIHETKALDNSDLLFDYMLNAVRLKQPISLQDFSYSTGLDSTLLIKKISYAKQVGWLEINEDSIELTEKGYLMSDEIVKLLL